MFRDFIGILKISFTVMLQFENNNLIIIGSLGIVVLMLGAVATHVRMKNPAKDMLPAITMLSIGLIIFLYTFGQAA
jgi:amino acid transporter